MNRPRTSPLANALELVGDRWTLLVIDALLSGPRRWNELTERVEGIAPNILSNRLKHLEREGLIRAQPYSERPVRLSYELTSSGKELAGALRLLAQWGAGSTEDVDPVRHADCGSPMEPRWYCPTCDRQVGSGDEEELRYL